MNIIFYDVDGTIYDGDPVGIRQNIIEAIHEVQDKKNLCFICSGRPYGFIAQNVKEIGFDGYILANGASVIYENKSIITKYLNTEEIKDFIQYFDEQGYEYCIATPEHTYIKKDFKYMLDFYDTCNIDTHKFIHEYETETILKEAIKIEVYYKDPQNVAYLNELLKDYFFMDQGSSLVGEITRKDTTKGTGIQETLNYLNIPQENSYCFGDGANDIDMFKAVAHPIAVENAIDEIKILAEDICDSVQNDGVATKLRELF